MTITEAQQRLPELLSAVEAGESVTIEAYRPNLHRGRSAHPTRFQSRLARLSASRQRQRADRSHRGIR